MIYNTPLTLEWMLGSSHVRGMLYIMVIHDTTSRRFVILGNNCIQHPSHIDLNLTNTRSNCVWKKCCSNQYKRNHLIQGEGLPGLVEFILYYKIYEQKVWRCSKKTKKKKVFSLAKNFRKKSQPIYAANNHFILSKIHYNNLTNASRNKHVQKCYIIIMT